MKKKVVALSTTIMLGLGSVIAIPTVKAESTNTLKTQKSVIQGQRSGIQARISTANSVITQAQDELAKLNDQISRIDQAIKDNNNMILMTEKKIGDTKSEVAQIQGQLTILKERISKRNEVLKKRALSYQETGANVSYLDVLLGASSFGDFVERIGAVTSLVEADQDLLKQHETDKKAIEKKQDLVESKLTDLNGIKMELVGMQAQIAEQKAQNEILKQQLKEKEQSGINQKASLQQQDRNLASKEFNLEHDTDPNSTSTKIYSTHEVFYPSADGNINDVIQAGYKYIGNSVYVFGGGRTQYDIANGRFDCSGFVHWAFAQAGIHVGASTDSLKYSGTQVPVSQMQPGDLVFFDTYKNDGHVGIYIGGGQFIGSQSSTGVAIANMSSGYWKQKFNGRVVRVL